MLRAACTLVLLTVACGPVSSMPTDSGMSPTDGGAMSRPDAGPTETDAGALPVDGGPGETDAGVVVDAGSNVVNDGGVVFDAGQPVDAGSFGGNDAGPDQPGPYSVTTVDATVTRGSRKTPVTAHVPAGAVSAPVVVFLPGFQLTTSMYLATVNQLASHGFVVVRADPSASIFSVSHPDMMADARAVIDWALNASGPLAGKVDSSRVGMMGHSLGGKLSIMAAAADPRVKAVFGIDPVNGGSPDVVPDQVTPLTIPLGFAGETVDASGGFGGMSCAPAAQNYTTFYDAATGASWSAEWTFADINHMDFVDNCSGLGCGVCNSASGDKAKARLNARTLEVAFFRRHLRGEVALDAYLVGAQVPTGLVTRHR